MTEEEYCPMCGSYNVQVGFPFNWFKCECKNCGEIFYLD